MASHCKVASLLLIGLATLVPSALCQTPAPNDGLAARTLYYNPGTEQTSAPVRHPTEHHPAARPAPDTPPAEPVQKTAEPEAHANVMTPVTHLGVRYNLVLVSDNGDERPADPDGTFHQGDCLSLRIEANHDGYLYVMEHGSTGKWNVLLPSAEMSDESNFVRARTVSKIPGNYCFSMDATPGIEHLFLIFSRNQEDLNTLNSVVRAQKSSAAGEPSQSAPVQSKAIEQIAMVHYGLQGRDLTIKKIAKPVEAGEPVNAVYVVNTTNTPSDRVVTEIQLKHQ